jgi:hypothetical protein
MDTQAIIDEIGDEAGWNDNSKLLLCLEYIQNQGGNDCFEDFLRRQAEEESGG